MFRYNYRLIEVISHILRTARDLSPIFYIIVVLLIYASMFLENIYILEMFLLVLLYSLYAASWDILSGYTQQDSYGHAMFIGGSGYLSAMMNKYFGIMPWLAVPMSASLTALFGLFVGWLTLRLRGPYFALSTIAFAAVLLKLVHIFSEITGGDEGLSGIATFTDSISSDIGIASIVLLISVILLKAFSKSHYGLILRSTQHNEDASQASGINTAYYKIIAFVISGFFAGIGGAMYAHLNMQVNPDILSAQLSVLIVLLAIVGGRGTIIGPVLIAGLFTFFHEWLRIIEMYRGVIFTGSLILLVYLYPDGFANAKLFRRIPILRKFLLDRSK